MDFLTVIRQESDLFYATAVDADPKRGVPCCPDWTINDLAWHLGEVHWFWATDIEQGASDPAQVEAGKPARPATYAGTIDWGRGQAERLVNVLASARDDAPVWTWALEERDHNVGFIRRHQVQEAAVHRWDMQSAASDRTPDPIGGEAAADSIDEFLAISLPYAVNEKKPLSGSVHLHCTDVPGEWFIEADGRVDRGHATADVALRGTASNLLLALYHRISIDALDVTGNDALARHLVERVDTE
jgi:uncharacterized protein (TIGR03083 family)